ncbi:MAG: DUF6265 family protein [Allosphingosinicella sp.]
MGRIWAVAAASVLLVGAAPATSDVSRLAWLSGSWLSESGDTWTQESWTAPRGGMMLGTGSSGRGSEARDWEHMRIAPDETGVLSFWGSPRGAPAVPFRLVSITATQAVFENARHDYPQRIAYRREGATLIATISLANGSKPVSWRYKGACPQNGRLSTARAP